MTNSPLLSQEKTVILTLDLGTSGVRASLYNPHGERIVGVGSHHAWALNTTVDGGAELDPALAFELTAHAIAEVLEQSRAAGWQIGAVGGCVLCPTVIGVSADGRPLTPVYTWADVRAAAAAAELRRLLDNEQVHQRTGCVLHAAYLPAKLRWIAHERSTAVNSVKYWCGLSDFIFQRLFGKIRCSLSVASWTGLLNRHTLEWDRELLETLHIRTEQLPLVELTDSPLLGLETEWASQWPELANVPWFLPFGDGAANSIGSGCALPDCVALMIATSGAVRVIWPEPITKIQNGLWCYRVDQKRLLLGGALSAAGNAIDWVMQTLGMTLDQATNDQLISREPAAHGLIILPFLAGERNPFWADSARGSVVGLSLKTQPIDLLQASLEAIIYQFAIVYDLLAPLLPTKHKIIASGGAITHQSVLPQLLADVIGKGIEICDGPEISSSGVALLVSEKLGWVEDISALAPPLKPGPAPRHDFYSAHRLGLARQQALYQKLISSESKL